MILELFILSYILGAVVTYGAVFSYWQGLAVRSASKYYAEDKQDAIEAGIFWPIQVGAYLAGCGRESFQSGLKFY